MEIKELLNENENLFNKVSYRRLIEILNKDEVNILRFTKSTNSYGSFQFINIQINDCKEYLTFYGLGLHEYRNRYYIDEFHVYSNYNIEKNVEILDKIQVIKDLKKLYRKIRKDTRSIKLNRTTDDVMFDQLADMADDDAVISFLY